MERPTVSEIAEDLHKAGIPPRLTADQSRLLIKVLQVVATGCPVSPARLKEIASVLHMPFEEPNLFLRQMSEFDEAGNIVGFLGLSQKKHSHRFQINRHILSTWCAWDTLFLPFLLKQTAKVESFCPTTKSKICLALSPYGVEGYEPANTVLSMVLPSPRTEGIKSVEEIWMILCHYVFFFSSTEAVVEWFKGKEYDPTILSVEEGFQLGRQTFAEVQRYA